MILRSSRSIRRLGVAMFLLAAASGIAAVSAEQAPKSGRPAQLWAVVIGVDDQIDPAIPDSKSCVRQASRMLGWLTSVAGWNRDHLLFLSDGGSNDPGLEDLPSANIRPSRKNLDWAFNRWLRSKNVLPDDVILVFYAGRTTSIRTEATPKAAASLRTILLASDALLKDAEATGLSLDDAMEPYARRGSYRIVYWLATNPSELDPSGRIPPAPAKPEIPPTVGRDWLRRLARWPGVTAWLAADRQASKDFNHDATSTLFTNALIDSLDRPGRSNLASGLKALQENPRLKLQGFQAAGGVPSSLTLRSDGFGRLGAGGPPQMVLQVGHAGKVNSLLTSADGRRIFSAGSDATSRVWSLDQKALLRVLTGHSVRVSALALSPDEHYLVTGGGRGTVIVHDAEREYAVKPSGGQPHTDDGGLEPSISQIAFLPDADHFVSIDQQGKSYIWNLGEAILAPKPWLPSLAIRDLATAGDAKNGLIVVLGNDGSIQRLKPDGASQSELVSALEITKQSQSVGIALSTDGKLLAIAREDGRVEVRDVEDAKKSATIDPAGIVRKLAFAGPRHLLVGLESGAFLFRLNDKPSVLGRVQLANEPLSQWAIAPDGTSIAACLANTGALLAWKIQPNPPLEATEVLRDDNAGVYSVAFAGDGSRLVGGGIDVSLKTWDLKAGGAIARGPNWESPINSGKIDQMSLSPERLHLLACTGIIARLWGLKDRSCRTIPGTWTSGLFVSESAMALASAADAKDAPGRLALVNVATLAADRLFFADKAEGFALPANTAFEALTLSADRRLLAASDSQSPLICVWDLKSGRLRYWTEALDEPALALSFSDDGKHLASGGGSAVTSVWELDPDAATGRLEKPVASFCDPSGQTVTSLKFRPKATSEVVTGHRDGRVLLWKWKGGKPDPAAPGVKPVRLIENFFDGEVKSLAFSDDGATFAAAGDGSLIWLGRFDPTLRRVEGPGARPHHLDQINDLSFWPGMPILASAGNDAAIRFWDLNAKKLWGTLSLVTPPAPVGEPDPDSDWVLFTPEGNFDASPSGRDRVRYRERDEAKPLEQFDNTLYSFRLGDRLRDAKPANQVDALESPIPLAIETTVREDDEPVAKLTVTIGSTKGSGPDDQEPIKSISDLRLYHNGVPIPTGLEDENGPLPRQLTVQVRLLEKINRFYAMASRQGAVDSRSPDLEIAYNGILERGRVHVVAIGVGDYDRLRLTYATSDAQSLSQVLHERGGDPKGKKGFRRILINEDVSRESLGKAFSDIVGATKERPQDTVVVFLAGHTGILEGERFCLLLQKFPFPKAEPLQVAMRGAVTETAKGAKLDASQTLPYTSIMRNLMRLDALNRLVIVDACQAEAILVDPQVIEINKWMEIGSRRARTSYLLAARRGDPALEFDPLQHGLFTFTLLRGMGAVANEECPEEVLKLGLPANADGNADGVLSTRELRGFVDRAMPRIAEIFPKLVAVKRSAVLPNGAPPVQEEDSRQFLQLQRASEISFPLIPLNQ